MLSFDDIEVRRPDLASSYLALLAAQPGRPIALFAPRRVGKTFFLDSDLAPTARNGGLAPVYADLWLHRGAPLDAINHALEEAIDDVSVPTTKAGRRVRTAVKSVTAFGAGIEFGDEPARRSLPSEPSLRLDALVLRLAYAARRPVLLMLDEAQTLGEHAEAAAMLSALRAVLHRRRQYVYAVLTGSSQDAIAAMVSAAGAPMYQFAQLLDFPVLGNQFLDLLVQRFREVHPPKRLSESDLMSVFQKIGYKPQLMKDIVKEMSAEGSTDPVAAFERLVRQERHISGWLAILDTLAPIDRALLVLIAEERAPLARDSIAELKKAARDATVSKVRASLERLKRSGLISSSARRVQVEDPLLRGYLTSDARRLT
jgi:hypothetical protein